MTDQDFRHHVVIIGAGLAGLSAAETLARHHAGRFRITLLEAKRSIGGRAGSFTDPASGETIDYCQHVAMGCCTNLIGLLDRCGISGAMKRYDRLRFYHPNFPASDFAPSRYLPAPLHLANTIQHLRYLNKAQRREVRRAMLRLLRTAEDRFVPFTARRWLESQGQSNETIDKFWNVFLASALGDHCGHVSMAAARKVFVDGFAAARGASDVLIPQRPLSQLLGHDLVSEVAQLGVEVRVQVAVETLLAEPSGWVGVKTRGGEVIPADSVISAIPWHGVDRLLEPHALRRAVANRRPFSEVPSSPITGVHLWFDREITSQSHAVLVGGLAQWIFRPPFNQRLPRHYYQVVVSGVHPMSNARRGEMLEQILQELHAVFPSAAQSMLLHHRIVTDPHAVFSVRPEVEAIRPLPPCPALPWLFLAGDWTRTGWSATMEGAVISGIQAASCVLQRIGLRAVSPDPGLPRGRLARWMIR
ncbi:hydroxysqualene dehydroxylase HpnE [Novipirellula artificiosorum]|uniref:15-cis-phytoene desaturase n=1 Tax=Novipirellula artificiosorum TaxID=2528016 RepID=A0A5C6E255_9BACT|nr:hydroxysqualene dehydroxylase HpnE [Novipirellula artificiosorum]TWU42057.1 15-cis-phytoene desaturase [Novipirellula artificiosorum]